MKTLSYAERMTVKLEKALQPITMKIQDDSAKHRGHAGHDGREETHFSLIIVSDAFKGQTAVERHRRVYDILADEMKERIHALALKALTSDEFHQLP